ncbi:glucosylglycerate hydrolase [Kineococcus esterisolvens]|uniref:glucosylglycerate hydrolase n=1 Tax=Kineococcus sp. SYSU DK016 TaxID=3383137 RepID=UPI003D7D000E
MAADRTAGTTAGTTAGAAAEVPLRERIPGTRRPARLTSQLLAARAAYVLRGNDLGAMTSAAPRLYPHMWSWDAAFVAVGLARLSVPRAVLELDTLLGAQWGDGMIPHIVFNPGSSGYFPGPERWGCHLGVRHAPPYPATSGICQPPVHAIAVQRIVEASRRQGRTERQAAGEFVDRAWRPLVAWHRWLATVRDPHGCGRVVLHHGWESGMDNSPRWDGPYSRVLVGAHLPPYERRDTQVVTDASARPTDREYDRYLWLVEEMRRLGYDGAAMHERMSFAVEDVLVSALLAVASDVLADLGEERGQPAADVADLRSWAARFRRGVLESVDPVTGLARDRDVRTGGWLATETVAGFAPLLCGGLPRPAEAALLRLFEGDRWCGHPRLVAAVPPSTSPASAGFRPREYWRGPQWPVIAWLFHWAFARRGWAERAAVLREEGLRLVGAGDFAEYYDPLNGEPLGSMQQSWTAAAVLDWLC